MKMSFTGDDNASEAHIKKPKNANEITKVTYFLAIPSLLSRIARD
jgi:hypothetical protein